MSKVSLFLVTILILAFLVSNPFKYYPNNLVEAQQPNGEEAGIYGEGQGTLLCMSNDGTVHKSIGKIIINAIDSNSDGIIDRGLWKIVSDPQSFKITGSGSFINGNYDSKFYHLTGYSN